MAVHALKEITMEFDTLALLCLASFTLGLLVGVIINRPTYLGR